MRLTEFISANMEDILQEFEDFARTHTAVGESMDVLALRDHAAGILETIVIDLRQPQSAAEQERKSKGDTPRNEQAPETAAESHGLDRAAEAFTLSETVAEFRALRGSVIRLWQRAGGGGKSDAYDEDQTRFNEAIDQALAESIDRYSTEIQRLQEQQSREVSRIAEGVSRARWDVLQIVSHELRTPLNAITGYTDLLQSGVYGPVPESQQPALRRIKFATEHLGGIVNGIMDLQRNRDDQPLEVERCTAGEAAAGVKAMAKPIAESCRVQFDVDLPDAGGLVWAHGPKLRQVLLNLITNALNHTPEGGRVWVDYTETPEEGCFHVHDTGPGIPQDQMEVIFEPFAQLDMSLTRERGGIGLGLTISRQLAHRMGGRIMATSEVGAGSTFTVALRRAGQ